MKKKHFYLQTIAIICLLVLSINCSAYASSQINVVSPEEAKELALFYYCSNQPTDDLISIDSYSITPLYDDEGNITYYAVDFFYTGEGKGYALIGGNLTDMQCPELSLEGSSPYYQTALDGNKTIYFNPSSFYSTSKDERVFYNSANQRVDEKIIAGDILEGDLFENRALLNSVSNIEYVEDSRDSFQKHPSEHLADLGYTNIVSTSTYGTCEPMMTSAGAFNFMFDIPTNGKYWVDGVWLYNSGHCAITAISNMLLYYRYKLQLTNLPSSYQPMFRVVLTEAVNGGYFSNTINGAGVNHNNVFRIVQRVLAKYSYTYTYSSNNSLSWSYFTGRINSGNPIYLRFQQDNPNENGQFVYDHHATVAFGYNVVTARRDDHAFEYKFIKVFDGWDSYTDRNGRTTTSTGKRYICWQALTGSQADLSIDQNGNVIDHSITANMYSFIPKIAS